MHIIIKLLSNLKPVGECWEWQGYTHTHGYGGVYGDDNKQFRVHRVAYGLAHGDFDQSLHVCHHCDNPICCNPAHLFLGTHEDNMRDMVRKGRSTAGEKHGMAKLTAAQVIEIRELLAAGDLTHGAIAKQYGVSRPAVSQINTGARWGVTVCIEADRIGAH